MSKGATATKTSTLGARLGIPDHAQVLGQLSRPQRFPPTSQPRRPVSHGRAQQERGSGRANSLADVGSRAADACWSTRLVRDSETPLEPDIAAPSGVVAVRVLRAVLTEADAQGKAAGGIRTVILTDQVNNALLRAEAGEQLDGWQTQAVEAAIERAAEAALAPGGGGLIQAVAVSKATGALDALTPEWAKAMDRAEGRKVRNPFGKFAGLCWWRSSCRSGSGRARRGGGWRGSSGSSRRRGARGRSSARASRRWSGAPPRRAPRARGWSGRT